MRLSYSEEEEQNELAPYIKTAEELSAYWASNGNIKTSELTDNARSFLEFDSILRFRDWENPLRIKRGSFLGNMNFPENQKYTIAFKHVEGKSPEYEGVDLSVEDVERMIDQFDFYSYAVIGTGKRHSMKTMRRYALPPRSQNFYELYMSLEFPEQYDYDDFPLSREELFFVDVYDRYKEERMKMWRENEIKERMRKTRQQEELKRRIKRKERDISYKKRVDNIKNIIALFDSYYQQYPKAELVDHDYITKDAVKYINIDNYLRYHKKGKRSYGLKEHERFYEKVYNIVKNEKTQKNKTVYLPDKMEDIDPAPEEYDSDPAPEEYDSDPAPEEYDSDPAPEELLEELLEEFALSGYFGEISTRTLPIVKKIIQFCVERKFTLYDLDQILAYFLTSIPADYSEPSITAACAIVMEKGENYGGMFLNHIRKRKILNRVKQICNKDIVDEPERTIYKCGSDYIWLIDFSWYTKSATSSRSICDYIDKIKKSKNAYVFEEFITDEIGRKIIEILERFVYDALRPNEIPKLSKTLRKSVVKPLEIPIRPVKVEEPDSLFSDEEFWEEREGRNVFDFHLDDASALREKEIQKIPPALRNIKYHKESRGKTPNNLPPTIYSVGSSSQEDLPPTIYSVGSSSQEDLPPTIYSNSY